MRNLKVMMPAQACKKKDQFFWFGKPCSNWSFFNGCVCVFAGVLRMAWQAFSSACVQMKLLPQLAGAGD